MANPQILTATQCAERVGVSVITWRYWHRHDRCPVKAIPGMKPPRWRTADIDALIERQQNPTKEG